MQDSIKILQKLISIDSRSDKSNKEIITYIKSLFKGNVQFTEQKFKKGKLDLVNLIVKIKGKSSDNPLVFVGHTDTVNPSSKWTRDPFKPKIVGDKIYGLGASDMKSGLAVMIAAGLQIKNPKRDVYLIFDADEEDQGTGGRELLKIIDFKDAEVIIPEPTDGDVTIGQKACFALKIETHGKTLHGSRTTYANNLKNSAIYKANVVINELIKLEARLAKKAADRLYGFSTQNIGQIQGGENVNSVADFCTFTIDRRLLPKENLTKEIEKTKKAIKGIVPDAKITVVFEGDSFSSTPSDKLVKRISSLAHKAFGKKKFKVSYGWNEAALFSRFGKAVVFGPGIHAQCHQPNEYASVKLIEKYAEIFQEIMQL